VESVVCIFITAIIRKTWDNIHFKIVSEEEEKGVNYFSLFSEFSDFNEYTA